MEYLIFEKLAFAITASIIIWYAMKRRNKDLSENKANPQELEDGSYAIEKPEDKFMAGVEYDSISSTIKPKTNDNTNDFSNSTNSSGNSTSDPSGGLPG